MVNGQGNPHEKLQTLFVAWEFDSLLKGRGQRTPTMLQLAKHMGLESSSDIMWCNVSNQYACSTVQWYWLLYVMCSI